MISEHIHFDRILLDGDSANQIIRALDTSANPDARRLISMLEDRVRNLRSALISYEAPATGADYPLCELLYETGVLDNTSAAVMHDRDLPLIRSWTAKERRSVVSYAASIKAAALGGFHKFKMDPNPRPECLTRRS